MAGMLQLVSVGNGITVRGFADDLAEPLKTHFGLECTIGTSLAEPKYAFNKDRNQYHSNAILRRLGPLKTADQFGVIGIGDVDLFLPDYDFVFGEADRETRAAMISLHRLRPEFYGEPQDPELLRKRARTEAVHEVGILMGLSGCDEPRCVMFFSTCVAETDRKGLALCHDCRAELARVKAMRRR